MIFFSRNHLRAFLPNYFDRTWKTICRSQNELIKIETSKLNKNIPIINVPTQTRKCTAFSPRRLDNQNLWQSLVNFCCLASRVKTTIHSSKLTVIWLNLRSIIFELKYKDSSWYVLKLSYSAIIPEKICFRIFNQTFSKVPKFTSIITVAKSDRFIFANIFPTLFFTL